MTMKQESKKYIKAVDLLRKAKPLLDSSEAIEREVIRRICASDSPVTATVSISDLLFGWTSIVWIRRSLIAASLLLVVVFVYQQSVILKQVNWLSKQVITNYEFTNHVSQSEFERRVKLLKIPGGSFNQSDLNISAKRIEMLLESLDKLQSDYGELMRIIQDDPELKELIEKKLDERNSTKVKL